jgi:hypothetical protein
MQGHSPRGRDILLFGEGAVDFDAQQLVSSRLSAIASAVSWQSCRDDHT